ncbi:hypothetical protein HHI36_012767 [Cryptolaemus montrouzieri]|uniref:Uncharacterized protein n=1 Tax=Cryptolaemus montrouzieri TaxID=559131 RepID=A0ABD2NFR9_9CUCU
MSGTLVKSIGFEWMLFGIAILDFMYAPLLISLKSPPTKEEKKDQEPWNMTLKEDCINNIRSPPYNKSLIMGEKSSVRYVTYQNEEDEEE